MQNSIIYKNSKITYSDSGKGTAVVLLHGFLENSTMWNEITNELEKKNRVITIDLLGHGNSDCIGYIHTMDDMAMAVKEVVKSLRIRKFYIIGHSMGGYVSLVFSEKYPKYIKGLCLLNSTTQADADERKELRLRACKMAQVNYENLVKLSVSNLFTAESREKFPLAVDQVKNEALKTTVQSYIAATKGMLLRENKESILQTINKRLIIAGKKDTILNFESILEESKRTNTPLYELPNGHMSHIEDKDEVVKIFKEFVKN